jgi:hypothetical protein
MVAEDRKEVAKQALRLGSHEVELNRIDTAFVTAAKAGTRLPAPTKIFGALTDASIACAEVIDTYEARPIPTSVRTGLSRLHCAITDLAASLKLLMKTKFPICREANEIASRRRRQVAVL